MRQACFKMQVYFRGLCNVSHFTMLHWMLEHLLSRGVHEKHPVNGVQKNGTVGATD